MLDGPNLATRNCQLGVPDQLGGCHTGLIGNHVIEGHMPPQDIVRFPTEKPDVPGLAVPGMPMGSPGMEMGESNEPCAVFAVKKYGSWSLYASH